MTALAYARLTRLAVVPSGRAGQPETVTPEQPDPKSPNPIPPTVEVQFNPTSLRVTYQNNLDKGGVSAGTQRRQYGSAQPATLSVDLEFDTAEEQRPNQNTGAAGPVDVRDKTARVRQFVQPPADRPSAAPPRVRFQWGTLIFDGIVTQVVEELDYFASDGTPLRAKLTVSITEQNLKFEAKATGSGARTDQAATEPGGSPDRSRNTPDRSPAAATDPAPGPGPGRSGTSTPQRVEPAVAGESAQQLATRVGGNPAAWRSLMNGLDSPLGIPAGAPVAIGPELGTASTLGRAAGFAAGAAVSTAEELAQVLGLGPAQGPPGALLGRAASAADSAAVAAGFALSAAGGVAAATAEVLTGQAGGEVAAARGAFAVPPVPAVPVATGGVLDPRSVTYGRAIPLRARVDLPTLADLAAGGRRSLAARARPVELPAAGPATAAPWERLPAVASGRAAAQRAQRGRDARPRTIRWRPGGECS